MQINTPRYLAVLFALAAAGLLSISGCSNKKTRYITLQAPPITAPSDVLPGVDIQITDVGGATGPGGSFRSGDVISVRFTLKTKAGDPMDVSQLTRGAIMVSGPTFNYQRVIASQSDLRERSVPLGGGQYSYTFTVPIPSGYLPPVNDTDDLTDGELTGQSLLAGTYTVGIELRQDYEIDEETYRDPGNATKDFLFGGATTIQPREVVTLANCTQCHDKFQVHGSNRVKITNCLLCHTAGSEDKNVASAAGGTPGVTVDFKVMIHKIHSGANLPSVNGVTTKANGLRDYTATPKPYKIVGFRNSVHDFSHVQMPLWPSLSSPMPRDTGYNDLSSAAKAAEDKMRQGAVACAKCHGDPDGPGPLPAPAQGDLAYTQPSRAACSSCHDDWVADHDYVANQSKMPPQRNDAACTLCHKAAGTPLDVIDAHIHPLLNPTLTKGTNFDLISVKEAGKTNGNGAIDPGEKVQVTFTVKDDAGNAVDATKLSGFQAVMNGPTTNPNVVVMTSVPVGVLGAGPAHTMNLPQRVYYERMSNVSTKDLGDKFTTRLTPHWNMSGALTTVYVRSSTLAPLASSLSAAAPATQNYVDLVKGEGTNFARNDFIVLDDGVSGKEEYLRIQWVDNDRLWFSSQYSSAYPACLKVTHGITATVTKVTLTPKKLNTDYTLDIAKGEIVEKTEFGENAIVVVDYTSDFIMPAVYQGTLNESPDLGEEVGDWVGKSIVSGTYTVGLFARQTVNVTVGNGAEAATTTYRDASRPAVKNVLVGDALTLTPVNRISSPSNCYSCHNDIAFHGGGRRGYETCLLCHSNAGAEDRPRYVAANAPATTGVTIDFRTMLHKIHLGKDMAKAKDYTVVGYGRTYPNNFSSHKYDKIGFPAMPSGTKACVVCHGKDNIAWQSPAARNHPLGQKAPTGVWRAACAACHDSDEAVAHINANTSPTGAESCRICHDRDETVNVLKAHRVR